MEQLFQNTKLLQLLEQYKPVWAIFYLYSLGNWDSEVFMPVKAGSYRAEAFAQMESLMQKLIIDPSFLQLFREVEQEPLNESEQGIIRLI